MGGRCPFHRNKPVLLFLFGMWAETVLSQGILFKKVGPVAVRAFCHPFSSHFSRLTSFRVLLVQLWERSSGSAGLGPAAAMALGIPLTLKLGSDPQD